MKKFTLFLLLALATKLCAWAQCEYSTLVVETKSGEKFEFWLYEKPRVKVDSEKMTFTCGKEVTGYVLDEVSKMYFLPYDPTTGIETPVSEDVIRVVYVNQSEIVVSGVKEADAVRLYTLDGHCVSVVSAEADGTLTVSLETLEAGTYILNIGNKQSFKFLKR